MEESANERISGLVSYFPVRVLASSLARFLAFSLYGTALISYVHNR